MNGKRVLVTGAGGFIGSHLVERLIRDGAHVRAMVHYRSDPSLHNLEYLDPAIRSQIEVVRGTIEDAFFVRTCVEGCDVVFHLAALIGIPYSYVAPASYVDVNTRGTLNVLEACRSAATPRLIHTSTSETYGTARYTPIDESHPLQAQSPYAATKISADKLAESYALSFGLPVVIVRPFNTYGPRQSARAVTATIVGQMLAGVPCLRLGSIEPVRDLTFVTDTVDGFICAARASGVFGRTFNLGTGVGVTIGALADRIMTLMGKRVSIVTEDCRRRPEASEVWKLVSSNKLAAVTIGWRPRVDLDEGLTQTIEFGRKFPAALDVQHYGI
jgi:NAD dependent epimerase/dehydratase